MIKFVYLVILVFVVAGALFFFRPAPSAIIIQTDMNELKIEDIVVGTGDEAVSGKKVTVNYLGTLINGTKFDSSYDRGVPFSFILGAGEVIKGWDQGIAGMKVGGKRKLTIPSSLGYGATGAGGVIPPKIGRAHV